MAYRNLLLKHFSVISEPKAEDASESLPKLQVRMQRTWKSNHHGPIIGIVFSLDGRLLATGGSDSTVKIWDLELQYCVFTLRGAVGVINCMYFEPTSSHNPTPTRFYYGGDDGKILCWDLKENSLLAKFDLHTSAATAVTISGNTVITAARDSVIGIYDRPTLKLKKALPIFENVESLVAMKSQENGTVLIGGGEKGTLKMWAVETGKCVATSSAFGSCIKQIFMADIDQQKTLVAVTEDHVIYLLNPADLSITKHLVGYNDEILDASFLTADSIAVASNSKDIRVYNAASGDCRLVVGHTDIVLTIDTASWNPNLFVSGSKDNALRLWRIQAEKIECIALATGHTNNVTSVRFARTKPNFVASVSDDTTLKIWKLPSSVVSQKDGGKKPEEPERLSSACTVIGHDKDVTCIDISPNDKLIATGSMDKTVKIWELAPTTLAATLVGTITGHKRGVWDVCFSPVDQVIATASGDWTVKIFALENFSCVKTFEGHQTTAIRVRFLPSGIQLLSTDSSGLMKLWNIKSGECAKTFDEHTRTVWALELNQDGSKLITGGGDSKLQLWKDVTEEEKELEHEKRAKLVADEQMLSNLVDQKKFSKALKLAIRLNRPYNAFRIMKDMLLQDQESYLESSLRSLDFDYVGTLLDWIAEWNTNSRNCHVAQKVLSVVLRQHPPERLMKLPNIKAVIEALIPYSERHFERLGRLRQQASFAQYSWQCMRVTGRSDDGKVDRIIKDEVLHDH